MSWWVRPTAAEDIGWTLGKATLILEQSWSPGEVPEDWKRPNITTIFNGEKEDQDNYRRVYFITGPG